MGELGIVVGKFVFKPAPVRLPVPRKLVHEPGSERIAGLIDQTVPAQAPEVFMDTDQTEGPSPWRCKISQRRQRLREKLSGHHLETSMRRTPYADAEGPER